MSSTQARRSDAATLDGFAQNTEAHGAGVENAAPLEIPPLLELSAREVEAFDFKGSALWLGGRGFALVMAGLAARVAVSTALLAPDGNKATVAGGYVFAFVLYMIGTLTLRNTALG